MEFSIKVLCDFPSTKGHWNNNKLKNEYKFNYTQHTKTCENFIMIILEILSMNYNFYISAFPVHPLKFTYLENTSSLCLVKYIYLYIYIYILKPSSCTTQFTNLWITSSGFSIKPSSDLFIIKSNTRKLIPACGIGISFPYNIHHKNLCQNTRKLHKIIGWVLKL